MEVEKNSLTTAYGVQAVQHGTGHEGLKKAEGLEGIQILLNVMSQT